MLKMFVPDGLQDASYGIGSKVKHFFGACKKIV
jgi:hypothetical protein